LAIEEIDTIEIQHLRGTRNERYFAETVSVSCVQGKDKYLDSNVSTYMYNKSYWSFAHTIED